MIKELQKQIEDLQRKINEIQNECVHPKAAVTSKNRADIGYWCSQDYSYWVDKHCSLCDKVWREEQ